MAKQYWIDEIFIDISRNQIIHLGESHLLPPKSLQVLTCLAKHQGRVVGYEEIMEHVWKDTIISPNTLQSSIAQLRKVLGLFD